jgi:tripartite-type tricarboxylate transporter receptor subunit TctC
MKRRSLCVASLLASLPLAPFAARAAASDIPLRIVVPYGPGGGMDGILRPLQEPLSKRLGVPIIIDYRPGGGTKIGTQIAAAAPPDGHTLVFMSPPGWIGYYYEGQFDFKPWETMTPVAQVAESPYSVIIVSTRSPYRSWSDLVAKAKQTGKPLMSSAPAAGGFAEMALHEIARQSGIAAVQIPYASAGPARIAVLSGEVDMQLESMSALSGIRGNQTRCLAVATTKRLTQLPDVPTFAEIGIKLRLPTNSFSLWGPAGMDPKVVDHLAQAIKEAVTDPGFNETVTANNLIEIGYRSGADIRKEFLAVDADWGPKLAEAVKAKNKR